MHDHDPDDAEMRAWLAGGKAPAGVCPHCGSRISVVQRGGQFTARCSHRGCGASGPRMATLVRAVEQFCAPPAYVARHMGISVHPSSLTDVVSVLEAERDALGRSLDASASTVALLSAQVGRAEAEVARLRGEYERGLREAAGLFADDATYWGETVRDRIISLLDAAPAAEVSDG